MSDKKSVPRLTVKCVTAATQAGGGSGFHHCIVRCTQGQYNNGEHYEAAQFQASEDGYEEESDMVTFDENDGPDWLFAKFNWEAEKSIDV